MTWVNSTQVLLSRPTDSGRLETGSQLLCGRRKHDALPNCPAGKVSVCVRAMGSALRSSSRAHDALQSTLSGPQVILNTAIETRNDGLVVTDSASVLAKSLQSRLPAVYWAWQVCCRSVMDAQFGPRSGSSFGSRFGFYEEQTWGFIGKS